VRRAGSDAEKEEDSVNDEKAIFKKFMMDAFGCVGLLKRTQKEASNAVDCGGMAP
jgi:hypothetical protein